MGRGGNMPMPVARRRAVQAPMQASSRSSAAYTWPSGRRRLETGAAEHGRPSRRPAGVHVHLTRSRVDLGEAHLRVHLQHGHRWLTAHEPVDVEDLRQQVEDLMLSPTRALPGRRPTPRLRRCATAARDGVERPTIPPAGRRTRASPSFSRGRSSVARSGCRSRRCRASGSRRWASPTRAALSAAASRSYDGGPAQSTAAIPPGTAPVHSPARRPARSTPRVYPR